jgi:hypothetical protein
VGRSAMLAALVLLSVGLAPTTAGAQEQGNHLSGHNGSSAGFHGGKTLRFPNGLAITLLTSEPAAGLTQYPGGPPLRPRHGYQFVTTTWEVRNTTNHTVTIASWVARSHGMLSRDFVTGNAGQMGLVPARATVRYYWLFEVASVGRVRISYGSFRPHWLLRG